LLHVNRHPGSDQSFHPTMAGSRKSKVWVANDRFSGERKEASLRLGTNRWPVRPPPSGRTRRLVDRRVRVSFNAAFPLQSHPACHMSHSPDAHQSFVRGLVRVRHINLPLAVSVLLPPQLS
jgi:hypothetical protein